MPARIDKNSSNSQSIGSFKQTVAYLNLRMDIFLLDWKITTCVFFKTNLNNYVKINQVVTYSLFQSSIIRNLSCWNDSNIGSDAIINKAYTRFIVCLLNLSRISLSVGLEHFQLQPKSSWFKSWIRHFAPSLKITIYAMCLPIWKIVLKFQITGHFAKQF